MSPAQRILAFMVILGGSAVLLRLASRRLPIPFPVVLAVAGIIGGAIVGIPSDAISPNALLLVFIPGLVFEGAINIDVQRLRRLGGAVAVLATVGVGATAGVVALVAYALTALPLPQAWLLGAILAPTDPIAVVSILRGSRAPQRLITLMEGESLFNDGTGIAVFAAVSAAIAGSGGVTGVDFAGRLIAIIAGGIGLGLLVGLAGVVLSRLTDDLATELLITFVVAYGSYLAADMVDASGVVSTVTAGVVMASVALRTRIHDPQMGEIWALLSFILNAVLFLLLGSEVPVRGIFDVGLTVLAVFAAMLLVRVLFVPMTLRLLDRGAERIPRTWWPLAVWGGTRGALSVALALSLVGSADIDPTLPSMACGVALLSLILQGSTSPAMTQRLIRRADRASGR